MRVIALTVRSERGLIKVILTGMIKYAVTKVMNRYWGILFEEMT